MFHILTLWEGEIQQQFIYLLNKDQNPSIAGSARTNAEKREKEERQARRAKDESMGQRAKPPTPTPATAWSVRVNAEKER